MTEDNNQQQTSQNSLMSEYNNILDQSLEKEKERIKTSIDFTDAIKNLHKAITETKSEYKTMSDAISQFNQKIDQF